MKIPSPQAIPVANYGPRLTQAQYDQRICSLPRNPLTREDELAIKRETMDISIDYKLGQNFPADRREQLWAVQKKFEKNFTLNLVKAVVTSPWDIFGGLSKPMVRGFAKVLTFDETKQFFDFTDEELKRFL